MACEDTNTVNEICVLQATTTQKNVVGTQSNLAFVLLDANLSLELMNRIVGLFTNNFSIDLLKIFLSFEVIIDIFLGIFKFEISFTI
jgi:hypothetical protein